MSGRARRRSRGTPSPAGPALPVTLLPSPDSPLVAFRVLFHVGSADDPRGKEGLAALTGALLAEGGSQRLAYADLLDALFPIAAGIGVQTDREVTVVRGTVHRDNLGRYHELLNQVLVTPRLGVADFERLKADQLNDLVNRLRGTDDEGLGKESLETAMYDGHPYGRPVQGTVRGLKSVTLEDVRAFWLERFTLGNVELGLAGGFPAGFDAEVASGLGGLPPGRPVRAPIPAARPPEGIEVTIVTKPCRAAAISIGFPISVTRADDDFYRLFVANSCLGEHRTFNGRLMNRMRGDRGLNYGDYSYVESFVQDGASTFALPNVPRRRQAFTIWIRPVAPEHAHFAIRQALRELDRLVRDGVTEEELSTTREFLAGYGRLWTQTASRRLGYALDGRFYGRLSLPEELLARLPSMTVTAVNDSIRRHLAAGDAYVAIVTDEDTAKALADRLLSDAASPIEYATATRPEVLEEDREIAVYPLPVNPRRIKISRADAMFEGTP